MIQILEKKADLHLPSDDDTALTNVATGLPEVLA